MGPVEKLLRKAGKKITPRGTVTTGVYARDAAGRPVSSYSEYACQWCVVGALNSVASSGWTHSDAAELLKNAAIARGYRGSIPANDSTKGTIAPDLYSDAIEAAAELGL